MKTKVILIATRRWVRWKIKAITKTVRLKDTKGRVIEKTAKLVNLGWIKWVSEWWVI